MNRTSKILLGSLVLALAVGMTTTTVAQVSDDADQNTDVDVSISDNTGLDVRPVSFTYSAVNPGTKSTSTSSGTSAIEIENIGSNNISDLWMGSSKPVDDPFGTGVAGEYDAGNFLQVNTTKVDRQPTGVTNFPHPQYVSRVEYVEPAPTFLQLPAPSDVGTGNNDRLVGRFRAADQWWFFAIYYDTSSTQGDNACGESQGTDDGRVLIGNDAHDAATTGTIDFTDRSNVEMHGINNISDSDAYGVLNDTITLDPDSETRDYTMLTYCDTSLDGTSHIQRVSYDIDAKNPATGGNTGEIGTGAATYLLSTSNSDDMLKPGQHFPMDLRIEVPEGVAEGSVSTGTLTVYAQAS